MKQTNLMYSFVVLLAAHSVCGAMDAGEVRPEERRWHSDVDEGGMLWATHCIRDENGSLNQDFFNGIIRVGQADRLAQVILFDHDEHGGSFDIRNYESWKSADVPRKFTIENRLKIAQALAQYDAKYQRHVDHLQKLFEQARSVEAEIFDYDAARRRVYAVPPALSAELPFQKVIDAVMAPSRFDPQNFYKDSANAAGAAAAILTDEPAGIDRSAWTPQTRLRAAVQLAQAQPQMGHGLYRELVRKYPTESAQLADHLVDCKPVVLGVNAWTPEQTRESLKTLATTLNDSRAQQQVNRLHIGSRLYSKNDWLNKLRAYRFFRESDKKSVVQKYNPIISSALDGIATNKKTPIILALIALLSYLARRKFNVGDEYTAAQKRLEEAEEALYRLVPAARTKPWYKPLSFVVANAVDATDVGAEKTAIQDAYSIYKSALSSYRRWRSAQWGSKLGMYGSAAGAVGTAAFRAHESAQGYLPDPALLV